MIVVEKTKLLSEAWYWQKNSLKTFLSVCLLPYTGEAIVRMDIACFFCFLLHLNNHNANDLFV